MGAGNGYWAKLLQLRGVDIVCFDLHVAGDDGDDAEGEDDTSGSEGEDDGEQDSEEQNESEKEEEGADGHENDDEEVEATNEGEHEGEGDEGESSGDEEYIDEDEDKEVEVEQIYWTEVLKGTPKVSERNAIVDVSMGPKVPVLCC